jgi:putative effector of murein hydrolase
LKNWKLGSIILLVILSIIIWVASGMLFSRINKWINYPIAIIVLIVGLIYINKNYNSKNS